MVGNSSLAPLISMLDKLASVVGFHLVETPPAIAAGGLGLQIWQSDFAILALVRVAEPNSACLEEVFSLATEWFSPVLAAEEKRGRLIDGYLLFALPHEPDEELIKHVHNIERDTSVCRKHVLWPGDDESWSASLNAVTTLGLPPSGPPSTTLTEPALPLLATRALDARNTGSSFYDVARMIEDIPEEADKNAS